MHDQNLKEKRQHYIENLSSTCITIKKDNRVPVQKETEPKETYVVSPKLEPCLFPNNTVENFQEKTSAKKKKGPTTIHSSIVNVQGKYPHIKLPKKSLDMDIAPIVSFTLGEVDTYFENRNLDMSKYIYRQKRIKKRKQFDSDSHPSKSATSQTVSSVNGKSMTVAADETIKNPELETSDNVLMLDDLPSSNKRKFLFGKDPSLKIKKISVGTPTNSTVVFDRLLPNTLSDHITSYPQDDPRIATKPDFIQVLGLTPATDEAVSQNSLICQICNNVQASKRKNLCTKCKYP
ncbi:unnamed protein product [Ceutorhynchus assimilis]|uniref:Uncharacterized protein n=1 Tax=Ceutorhynchus assimilis TaxID=467358 RepID=A0A9N9QD58_9CUCU|nr:unnamed protein product [Ceutorhynchus assimilis]